MLLPFRRILLASSLFLTASALATPVSKLVHHGCAEDSGYAGF